jgi:hypothetical protein
MGLKSIDVVHDGGTPILPRIREALGLIERSAAFEGDGDLAAAHLVLSDIARQVSEALATRAMKSAPLAEPVGWQWF